MKKINQHLENLKILFLQGRIHLKKTQIDKVTLFMLCLTPLLCFAWWWGFLIEPVNKIDLFIFIDFEQKLKWYFHYTAYHIENIIMHAVVYRLCRVIQELSMKVVYSRMVIVSEILLYFSIFRLLEYWMFRGQTSIMGLSTSLAFISLFILLKWLRKS